MQIQQKIIKFPGNTPNEYSSWYIQRMEIIIFYSETLAFRLV